MFQHCSNILAWPIEGDIWGLFLTFHMISLTQWKLGEITVAFNITHHN